MAGERPSQMGVLSSFDTAASGARPDRLESAAEPRGLLLPDISKVQGQSHDLELRRSPSLQDVPHQTSAILASMAQASGTNLTQPTHLEPS